jgi:hypothetical protein
LSRNIETQRPRPALPAELQPPGTPPETILVPVDSFGLQLKLEKIQLLHQLGRHAEYVALLLPHLARTISGTS